MDVLAEVMRLLRIEGQLYGRLEFTAPWGFEFPGEKGVCLMVTRGSCYLGVDTHALIPLVGGDFVFLPAPHSYSLQSSPEIRVRSVLTVISDEEFRRERLITHGGGGMPTSLIAGCFRFETPESEWLVKYLPPILRVSASDAHSSPWFQSTLQFLATELAQELPGAAVIVDRLAEVVFVQALRTWIQLPYLDAKPSWLHGLADPQIGEALQRMYAEPERAWTVPELAHAVSMSRSAFAARFRTLVGDTPLNHLTHWRMVRAASLMREQPSATLAAIAAAVGYGSESAFGKVFRRAIGVSPGKYRQDHQHDTKQTV
ncbi:MAG TPA: AraC family transcriptional regulator [Chthonomonadaceae bacterium]|nr:AraC family transcriptional regulator [Chthonomonadaceae bacterium]